MLLRIAAAAALATAAAGCGGGGGEATTRAAGSRLPPGCEVPVIRRAVDGFLTARTRAQLDRRLSAADDFVRLTIVDAAGHRFSTADRAEALDRLVRQRRAGERLRLLQVRVAPGVDANHVTVAGSATRLDPANGRDVAVYDGSIDCVTESVTRLRMQPSG